MNNITQAIHADMPCFNDSHSEAIAMTSAYDFSSAEQAQMRFSGEEPGNVYSRFTNPSTQMFERKLAALEGAEEAVAVASGMAAYLAIAMTFLKQGDHVLMASGIFGTTTHLFRQYFGQFGIDATSVQVDDASAWKREIKLKTKLIIVESPTNPLLHVADIPFLADLAKKHDALLIVDNTLLTPIFQNPIKHGADLVLHSAGKFLDGQGRCVGGAIAGSSELVGKLKLYLRSAGICLSPFNGWILSKGIETLEARMLLHERNCKQIYHWLRLQDSVIKVISTLDEHHPNAAIITRQQFGHSPILSFEINGNQEAAFKFINALNLVSRCTNIGDAKTMVTHPASTTHSKYSDQEKKAYGISGNMIRLCIGLDNYLDVISDLKQAFMVASKQVSVSSSNKTHLMSFEC
jgi:O-succinylhomoserine sulfhydrylase